MHGPDHNQSSLLLPDAAATDGFGAALAECLVPGLVVWLQGELGAGKTAVVRACLRALGHRGPVKSPTYALLELYVISSLYCYHFDFYRFNEPKEFEDAGLGEYFDGNAVCFVEWADKAEGFVPPADLVVRLLYAGDGRRLELAAGSERGRQCLTCLLTRLPPPTSIAPGGD